MHTPRPTLSLMLDAGPDAPSRARAAIGPHIDDPEARADLELAASELVTNAVGDGPGSGDLVVLLDLEVELHAYVLTVSSSVGPAGHAPRAGEALGLSILRALGCEVAVREEGHRTIATCRLPRADAAPRLADPA